MTLAGQTVVVIGGSAGIGFETARSARAEGADVILTGRNPERLERAARELGARSAAVDATDLDELERFFAELPEIDHIMLSGSGPYYAPLAELDFAEVQADIENRPVRDGEMKTACQQACPAQAITFGNLADVESAARKQRSSQRNYSLLAEQGTRPRTTYLARVDTEGDDGE